MEVQDSSAVAVLSTGVAVFGTASGNLVKSDATSSPLKLHSSKVSSIRTSLMNVVSGDLSGKVLLLDFALTVLKSFELGASVISLDQDLNSRIVVALSNGTIVELTGEHKTQLVAGHFKVGVNGLLSVKASNRLISAGADKVVVWDVQSHKVVEEKPLIAGVTCVSQSRSSNEVALGLSNNTVEVWSTELTLKNKYNLASTATCLAWDGPTLAVGTASGTVCIFTGKSKHDAAFGSAITGMDWSEDSSTLQVCTASGELKYLTPAAQNVDPVTCRNFAWTTWTCAVGWHVPGLLVPACQVDKVKVVRSNANFVVVGDVWGLLRISGFPCPEPSDWQFYRAHGSEVTAVEWSSKGERLWSGSSNCVMQWRLLY